MKRYEDHDWQASMKLRVDYNNMLCSHVGQYGIDPSALQAGRPNMPLRPGPCRKNATRG